jgi:hypothetical protein
MSFAEITSSAIRPKPIVRWDIPPIVEQCLIAVKPEVSFRITEKNREALKVRSALCELPDSPNFNDPAVGVSAAGFNNTR